MVKLAMATIRAAALITTNYNGSMFVIGRCFSSSSTEKLRNANRKKVIDLSAYPPEQIRNFGIVAHVDHGKSTLADRLLELTGVIDRSSHGGQMLDKLQVERERGITVKAQSCTMFHEDCMLNLIDTPGHADFSFEVSRSLAATNGIILLVAANQGVEAQTVANFWLAFEAGLTIIPVINKIDLNSANVPRVVSQMENSFDFSASEILRISAKNGTGITDVLDAIVERLPPPKGDLHSPFRAHIFDSWYETHRGPMVCVIVHDGGISKGQKIRTYHTDCEYEVLVVGIMNPNMHEVERLYAGQVGFLLTTMKSVQDAVVGETLYDVNSVRDTIQAMPLLTPSAPCIYASIYPTDMSEYSALRIALHKLALNDSSVQIQHDSSIALGNGFKIGFSGLLHMEVFCARLEQEYDANVTITAPSVEYRAVIKDNPNIIKKRYNGQRIIRLLDASNFPAYSCDIDHFLEPMIKLTLLFSGTYCEQVARLCNDARGEQVENNGLNADYAMQQWRLPFAEVCTDFFERLKRITSGYVTYNYQWDGFQPAKIELLVIHINDLPIYEFSEIMPANQVKSRAKEIVKKLREEIPRQQYEVRIKATLGQTKKALVQTIIAPIKKDFTGRLKGNFGGGGWERLCKKLSDQKKGKERMKQLGQVQIPKEAFINVLRR
uniref:Translation factor GUF1 homolog, mitochondrial n=1 Tax=Elaeophora elaphi TaxID=1147741 RepID=A0A0R3S4M6_9BILA